MLLQQLLSRGLTFALNILLARLSDLRTMGSVLQLELLSATVLFVSRESIRNALLRGSTDRLAFNLAFVPVAIGSVLCLSLYCYYSYTVGVESVRLECVYLVAAMVELASEPFYVLLQRNLMYAYRVRTEGTAFITQCVCTLVVFLLSMDSTGTVKDGVWAHAVAQLAFSVILLVGYFVSAVRSGVLRDMDGPKAQFSVLRLVPIAVSHPNSDNPIYFDAYHVQMSITFFSQSIVKHFLTVGDKMALVAFGIDNARQGAYRLVSDLGIDSWCF